MSTQVIIVADLVLNLLQKVSSCQSLLSLVAVKGPKSLATSLLLLLSLSTFKNQSGGTIGLHKCDQYILLIQDTFEFRLCNQES